MSKVRRTWRDNGPAVYWLGLGMAIGLLFPTLWVPGPLTQVTTGWVILAFSILGFVWIPIGDYVRRRIHWLPDPPLRPRLLRAFTVPESVALRPDEAEDEDIWMVYEEDVLTTNADRQLHDQGIDPSGKAYNHEPSGETFYLDDSKDCYIEVNYKDQKGWVGVNIAKWASEEMPYAFSLSRRNVRAEGLKGDSASTTLEKVLDTLCTNLILQQRRLEARQEFNSKEACAQMHDFVRKLD